MRRNRILGQEIFNPSYVGARPDVEALIPPFAKYILDVGCSNGKLGESIKINHGACVWGIELSPSMANVAKKKLDKVFVGDAQDILQSEDLCGIEFDLIIFADILEHLVDPWDTLKAAVSCLNPDGGVIVSIPNIRHIDTLYNLIFKNYWPYRDRGIHDKTHLRFFTLKNIYDLLECSGLVVDMVRPNYRIIERPHDLNRFAKYFAFPGIKSFLTFQYVIYARKASCDADKRMHIKSTL